MSDYTITVKPIEFPKWETVGKINKPSCIYTFERCGRELFGIVLELPSILAWRRYDILQNSNEPCCKYFENGEQGYFDACKWVEEQRIKILKEIANG